MRRAFLKFCTVIGVLMVALVAFVIFLGLVSRFNRPKVAARTVLELSLDSALPEAAPEDPFALLSGGGRASTLRDHVDALQKASTDASVQGLVVRLGAAPISFAQMQELRAAFTAFRAKKKFIYAYAESFGGLGNYYLATAADRIFLLPGGDATVLGIHSDQPFIRGLLEKVGITPHFEGRYEYKNMTNFYMERKFTDAHREATGKLAGSLFDQAVRGIADGRKLAVEQVKAIIDKGPYHGQEVVDAKLADELAYRDEVNAKAKAKAGDGAQLLFLSEYLGRAGRPNSAGDTIALIYGQGAITQGTNGFDPTSGESSMGSDTISAAFRQAINDKKVKAIVFRVDSPGGSAVASDVIGREVQRARKAGKPVVASMGNVAASGGYWVSMDCDRIVASPGTITGSIGVLSGKMITKGLWDKLGVTFDGLKFGQNSTMYDGGQDFSPTELERFRAGLDFIYKNFTTRVAAGRKMKLEDVQKIAKGRVWSGEDAKGLGLVDELGGLQTALAAAKKLAKIGENVEVDFRPYPRPKTPFEALMERFRGGESGDNSETSTSVNAATTTDAQLGQALRTLQPLVRRLRETGLLPQRREELMMLPLDLRY